MMPEYIERNAAYPLAKKICDAIDSKEFQRLNFGMLILDWIDDIPTADVRPVVRGRWDDKTVAFFFKCSECGCCVGHRHDVFLDRGKLNYCPNRGAKMEES